MSRDNSQLLNNLMILVLVLAIIALLKFIFFPSSPTKKTSQPTVSQSEQPGATTVESQPSPSNALKAKQYDPYYNKLEATAPKKYKETIRSFKESLPLSPQVVYRHQKNLIGNTVFVKWKDGQTISYFKDKNKVEIMGVDPNANWSINSVGGLLCIQSVKFSTCFPLFEEIAPGQTKKLGEATWTVYPGRVTSAK